MGRVRHLVWDWNGTLFDDAGALIDATIAAFHAAGLPPITRRQYQRLHVKPPRLFFERLADRPLTDAEHDSVVRLFREAYHLRRGGIRLTHDAVDALTRWRRSGRGQSLLSMYEHSALVQLVLKSGIADFFTRVDGLVDSESGHKAPHLARHLTRLGLDPAEVALIGDSADDAAAAAECGAACVLYHSGEHALHSPEHLAAAGVPVVRSLREGVDRLLAADA